MNVVVGDEKVVVWCYVLGEGAQTSPAHHHKVGVEGFYLPEQLFPFAHVRHHYLGLEHHLGGRNKSVGALRKG
jgi:hypothetical protein